MNTSSAKPISLLAYAESSERLNVLLRDEARRVGQALDEFQHSCTEFGRVVDGDLDGRLRTFALTEDARAAWVRDVAAAFIKSNMDTLVDGTVAGLVGLVQSGVQIEQQIASTADELRQEFDSIHAAASHTAGDILRRGQGWLGDAGNFGKEVMHDAAKSVGEAGDYINDQTHHLTTFVENHIHQREQQIEQLQEEVKHAFEKVNQVLHDDWEVGVTTYHNFVWSIDKRLQRNFDELLSSSSNGATTRITGHLSGSTDIEIKKIGAEVGVDGQYQIERNPDGTYDVTVRVQPSIGKDILLYNIKSDSKQDGVRNKSSDEKAIHVQENALIELQFHFDPKKDDDMIKMASLPAILGLAAANRNVPFVNKLTLSVLKDNFRGFRAGNKLSLDIKSEIINNNIIKDDSLKIEAESTLSFLPFDEIRKNELGEWEAVTNSLLSINVGHEQPGQDGKLDSTEAKIQINNKIVYNFNDNSRKIESLISLSSDLIAKPETKILLKAILPPDIHIEDLSKYDTVNIRYSKDISESAKFPTNIEDIKSFITDTPLTITGVRGFHPAGLSKDQGNIDLTLPLEFAEIKGGYTSEIEEPIPRGN